MQPHAPAGTGSNRIRREKADGCWFGGAEVKRETGNDWRLEEAVKNGSPAGARPGG